jgi:alkylation response protein AidB-like acyl-CoA dehydrogenase
VSEGTDCAAASPPACTCASISSALREVGATSASAGIHLFRNPSPVDGLVVDRVEQLAGLGVLGLPHAKRRVDEDRDRIERIHRGHVDAARLVVDDGAGKMAEYGIERFYRDARLFRIDEGTTQIQQIVIARNMVCEARR